jgi:hypothetical protein
MQFTENTEFSQSFTEKLLKNLSVKLGAASVFSVNCIGLPTGGLLCG